MHMQKYKIFDKNIEYRKIQQKIRNNLSNAQIN